jgi:hypothetical protein
MNILKTSWGEILPFIITF